MKDIINKLMVTGNIDREGLTDLLKYRDEETTAHLYEMACLVRDKHKKEGNHFIGRIPLSNYCKFDCKMCGIRRENQFAKRYRLKMEDILRICAEFRKKGINQILLESGDDVYLTEDRVAEIILTLKRSNPNVRIILSLGEKNEMAYRHWKQVGASGYLFHHGCANEQQFKKIYPSNMSSLLRKQHMWQLKEIGYQTGTGFLVGMPYQMLDDVVDDMLFMKEYNGHFIDMSLFVPALRTPFERERSGNGEMTLYIMAIFRLLFPDADIIANPTLDCVLQNGRKHAKEAGANLILIDTSEIDILNRYHIYERKYGRMILPIDQIENF